MKNTIKKTPITVEQHCLELVYAPIRLRQRGKINQLMASIEQHGQLVPVIIVAKGAQRWVLIDGYLRLNAMQRLGKDTIAAEIWDCTVSQALLVLLAGHQSRIEPLEEALLLRELKTEHGFSQNAIAERVGRDKSWVSRRLGLIEGVADFILEPVLKGSFSLWAAQRVLVPLARANTSHGEKLLAYLLKNHTSTRELQLFYEHYQRANHQERAKMVNEPGLFFKVKKMMHIENEAKNLRAGPEGKWQSMLGWIASNLKQVIVLTPQVLFPYQESQERARLLSAFYQVASQFNLLSEKLEGFIDANQRDTTNNFGVTPEREKLSSDQQTA